MSYQATTGPRPKSLEEHVGTLNIEEFNAIAHIRGWCHYGPECPICREQRSSAPFWKAKGRQEAIHEIAQG